MVLEGQLWERVDSNPVSLASSRGRGPRAAGWFSDYIAESSDNEMESVVLQGGIKGWATAGDEFIEWMDEYDPCFWSARRPVYREGYFVTLS